MPKPNSKVKKAFALASIAGAMIMTANSGRPKLVALKVQIDKAMKVFSIKASRDYYVISHDIQELWSKMAERHDNKLTVDEVEVFIDMVLNLLPRADMKAFLGISYTTSQNVRDKRKSSLLVAVMELDAMLNKMFSLEATATRDSIARVMVKPIKTKAVKKERDKAKPKALKMIKNRIKWNKRRLAV